MVIQSLGPMEGYYLAMTLAISHGTIVCLKSNGAMTSGKSHGQINIELKLDFRYKFRDSFHQPHSGESRKLKLFQANDET